MLLALKLTLAPLLVAGVTLAARRWGARIGGLVTALPVVSGPALVLYALEQGHAFASGAAGGSLLGIVGVSAFCVVYARLSRHTGWIMALTAGWAVCLLSAAVFSGVDVSAGTSLVIAIVALAAGQLLLPRQTSGGVRAVAPPWDLPLRMAAAAALVLILTAAADRLGPRLSGLLTPFPVATSVLAVFTHARHGSPDVIRFAGGLLPGLHSFAVFCFVLSVTLGPLQLGLAAALASALAVQLTIQAVIFRLVTK
jgi:hypothetical protein